MSENCARIFRQTRIVRECENARMRLASSVCLHDGLVMTMTGDLTSKMTGEIF